MVHAPIIYNMKNYPKNKDKNNYHIKKYVIMEIHNPLHYRSYRLLEPKYGVAL
jgi:hypothetical protein